MLYMFIFILGLVIGSFLNVCIYRIPKGESVSYPPSHCTACGTRIKWYDLIPVISYILLKGKCRSCNERISVRYPFIELVTGIIFVLLYMKHGLSLFLLKYIILSSILIVVGVIDLDTQDIYFKTTLTGIISGVIFMLVLKNPVDSLIGAALGGGVISAIILLTHGMGWGDAEVCMMCGLFIGSKLTVLMLFISFLTGGIIGILLILMKKKGRKDMIPFGPFISIAAIATMIFGNGIISWYLSLL